MNKENYIEAQKAFIKMTGLKIGSKVKILRKAESNEYGWGDSWTLSMEDSGEFIVNYINDSRGLSFRESSFYYPFFVLQVLDYLPNPIFLNDKKEYQAVFNMDKSVTVGCQNISFETLEKIYETAKSICASS